MKKILFLLLCSVSIYAQNPTGQEQEFDYGIRNNAAQIVTSADTLVTNGTGGTYGKISKNDLLKEKAFLSTGLLKQGILSINVDNTKFNLSAGEGVYSDFTDPDNVIIKRFYFPSFIGVTPAFLNTGVITYVAVNYNGGSPVIVQQATPFTNVQRRDYVLIGALIHSNLTNINVVNEVTSPSADVGGQLGDVFKILGNLNFAGNKFTANGANLTLNKSAGTIFKYGSNFGVSHKDPHYISQGAQTSLTFRYRSANGFEGSDRLNLDPDNIEVDNVTIAMAPNTFSIQTVFLFQSGTVRVQRGQTSYTTLALARAAINTREFVVESNIGFQSVKRAYIIMRKGTTSLLNTADAEVIEATKYDGTASGGVVLTDAAIIAALGFTPENVANKQNSLAIDGTGFRYPTVDAVNANVVHKTGDIFDTTTESFNPLLSRNKTTLDIEERILEPESTSLPLFNTTILCWGDSLTAGAGSTLGFSYPSYLETLTAFDIINKGVGGETSTQIKDRFIADTGNYDKTVIIWAGRNNATDPTTIKADIATMIAALTHDRYFVVGIINGEYPSEYAGTINYDKIVQLNNDLSALYGKKYIPIRERLVSLHDETAQGLLDFSRDIVPYNLRSDNIHLNDLGYTEVAKFIFQRLGILLNQEGYLQSKDVKGLVEGYGFMHLADNETFTGVKSSFNTTNTVANGLYFSNSGVSTTQGSISMDVAGAGIGLYGSISGGGSVLYGSVGASSFGARFANSGTAAVRIDNTSSASNGILINTTSGAGGINVTNNGSGNSYASTTTSSGPAFAATVNSIGAAYSATVNANGVGAFLQNVSTGTLMRLNSLTASTGDIMQIRKNNVNITRVDSNGIIITPSPVITPAPVVSAGTYEFLTRNTVTELVEKIPSANVAPIANPTFTGVPTAPTAAPGTTGNQIANLDFVENVVPSGTITTTVSITNATLTDLGYSQNKKTLLISNGANNINYTVNAGLTASFVKGGTGIITFTQGAGRTLVGANGTLVFNGLQYSTASIVSFGTTDIIYINNF